MWPPWRPSSVLTPVHCLTAPKVWGLGNIAGDSTQLRDHVLSYSFVEKLAEMILQTLDQGGNKQLIRNATWTLSNCVRGKPRPPMEVARTALPLLARLIRVDDDETMADAAYVFVFFRPQMPSLCVDDPRLGAHLCPALFAFCATSGVA